MKKYILYIICILLLTTPALADLEIKDIRIYVENEPISGADEDGGTVTAYQDDNIDVIVDLDNNIDNTTKVKLMGTIENIDDGNDIEKIQDWYDIDANEDRAKTLSFHIPNDANSDEYDFELLIMYEYANGTDGYFDVDYDLVIKQHGEEIGETDLKKALHNLSNNCNSMVTSISDCMGYINSSNSYEGELYTCIEQRAKYNDTSNEKQEEYDDCQGKLTTCKSNLDSKDMKMGNMFTREECDTEIESGKMGVWKIIMFIGVAIGIILFFKKKKEGQSLYGGQYMEQRMQ